MYSAMRENQDCSRDMGNPDVRPKGCNIEGKLPLTRSAFMRTEEIEREREQSGWNPYAGEEETQEEKDGSGRDETPGPDRIRPYFAAPDGAQTMEEQQEAERELRRLQSMYPEAAKQLLPYVEEECDKMEYEGSPMFDEYPDRSTVYRMGEHIFERVKDQFPGEEAREPEEILPMQLSAPGTGSSGGSLGRDLARVLLLNEIHYRRCRYRSVIAQAKSGYRL